MLVHVFFCLGIFCIGAIYRRMRMASVQWNSDSVAASCLLCLFTGAMAGLLIGTGYERPAVELLHPIIAVVVTVTAFLLGFFTAPRAIRLLSRP
jgi:hypothetical protein